MTEDLYSSRAGEWWLKTFTAVAPADDDWRPLQQSRRQMMTEDLYSSRAGRWWLKTFTAVAPADDDW